jgi:hypothetical protein
VDRFLLALRAPLAATRLREVAFLPAIYVSRGVAKTAGLYIRQHGMKEPVPSPTGMLAISGQAVAGGGNSTTAPGSQAGSRCSATTVV